MSYKKEELPEVISSRSGKLIGYCCKCNLMLSDLNEEGSKYKCSRCGHIQGKREIKKDIERNKYKNKREYLKGNSGYYGDNFHMNKSTTEYNKNKNNINIKETIIKENDEEDTLDD